MLGRPGYSLLELLVTIGVIAIVITGGIPLMHQLIHTSRLNAEVNALIRGVQLARSDAVKRNGSTVLCASVDGASCVPAARGWSAGWLVFANTDRDSPPAIDADETILAFHRVPEDLLVHANRQAFIFHGYARRSTNGTFVFCPSSSPPEPRAVVISYTGRPRSANRRSDGKPYSCGH